MGSARVITPANTPPGLWARLSARDRWWPRLTPSGLVSADGRHCGIRRHGVGPGQSPCGSGHTCVGRRGPVSVVRAGRWGRSGLTVFDGS